jgi:hypothetical protein
VLVKGEEELPGTGGLAPCRYKELLFADEWFKGAAVWVSIVF